MTSYLCVLMKKDQNCSEIDSPPHYPPPPPPTKFCTKRLKSIQNEKKLQFYANFEISNSLTKSHEKRDKIDLKLAQHS